MAPLLSLLPTLTGVSPAHNFIFEPRSNAQYSGRDGSRQVTMTVDATGAGKNFVAGTVTTNGVAVGSLFFF